MSNGITHRQIVDYYDSCNIDYKLIWNLDRSYAMHFGYWDEKVKNFSQSLERENEILAEMAKIKGSDVVLDAGCGVGGSSIFLAKKFGCKVVGITLSKKQAEQAIRNAERNGVESNTEFLVMDFENMTFPDKTFDVVWTIESICHASNKKKFIEGVNRILKPNGRLIIAESFAVKKDYEDKEKGIMQKWLSGWGINFLETVENFKKYLANTGFQKISFLDITDYIMPSSKRLYKYSLPGMFFGKIAEFFKIRTKTQTGNIVAARYQHKALQKKIVGIWNFLCRKAVNNLPLHILRPHFAKATRGTVKLRSAKQRKTCLSAEALAQAENRPPVVVRLRRTLRGMLSAPVPAYSSGRPSFTEVLAGKQGEMGRRGGNSFRPPKFQRRRGPAISVRIFSNRHRQ